MSGTKEALDGAPGATMKDIASWFKSQECPKDIIRALRDLTSTPNGKSINIKDSGRDILARYLYYLYRGDDEGVTPDDPKNKLRTVFLETYQRLFNSIRVKEIYEEDIPTKSELDGLIYATVNARQSQGAKLALATDIHALKRASIHYGITELPQSIVNFNVNDPLPSTLSADVAGLTAELEKTHKVAAEMRYTRPDAKQPAVPSVVVYSCIEKELQTQGVLVACLQQETAKTFAEFAVACGKPNFGKIPKEAHRIAKAKSGRLSWPVLRELNFTSKYNEMKKAIDHVPSEQILHLIAHIRNMVTEGKVHSDQIPWMGVFSGHLEKIAAKKYAEPIAKAEKTAVYKLVETTHMAIEEALAYGAEKPHETIEEWQNIEPVGKTHQKIASGLWKVIVKVANAFWN